MPHPNSIKSTFDLSVDFLEGYVIDNHVLNKFDDRIIAVTGFENFTSDIEKDIFTIASLETVMDNQVVFNRIRPADECSICGTQDIDEPMTDIYISDDARAVLKGHSTDYAKTALFNICRKCQSGLLTDMRIGTPDSFKVGYSL